MVLQERQAASISWTHNRPLWLLSDPKPAPFPVTAHHCRPHDLVSDGGEDTRLTRRRGKIREYESTRVGTQQRDSNSRPLHHEEHTRILGLQPGRPKEVAHIYSFQPLTQHRGAQSQTRQQFQPAYPLSVFNRLGCCQRRYLIHIMLTTWYV
ncbi:hypothetical protein P154DRAFT_243181 [Amniculicola lignicola CBS 123094]|uniref:Uncharacterized protein n=1 Tax=Amniculicola lignicola CBS 123094 TaxID=1392246 RepID=A0A6A5WD48_9PLEO|nr:hypothetical protein P154DRAFT_243181 [Amniculicola lignicola CBS 123094]